MVLKRPVVLAGRLYQTVEKPSLYNIRKTGTVTEKR